MIWIRKLHEINAIFKFIIYFPSVQHPQMPNDNNETTNYERMAAASSLLDLTNNLVMNNVNVNPINDNLTLLNLITALNGIRIGDMGQSMNGLSQQQYQQQQQQHTCGMNPVIDCNASTIGTFPAECTKKYQKAPVPPDYMCHLCFSKDHFIRDCPQVSSF